MEKTLFLFPSMLLILQFTFSFNQGLFMHIKQGPKTKKTFCWHYTKYTRKLLSVSLKASVKRRTEPLNDRCFDFTDEFKHSELSHFTLQTTIQHKKSKTKRQITVRLFLSQSEISKRRYPGWTTRFVFLSPEDESRSLGTGRCCSTALMISNSYFILKTIFCRSTKV